MKDTKHPNFHPIVFHFWPTYSIRVKEYSSVFVFVCLLRPEKIKYLIYTHGYVYSMNLHETFYFLSMFLYWIPKDFKKCPRKLIFCHVFLNT